MESNGSRTLPMRIHRCIPYVHIHVHIQPKYAYTLVHAHIHIYTHTQVPKAKRGVGGSTQSHNVAMTEVNIPDHLHIPRTVLSNSHVFSHLALTDPEAGISINSTFLSEQAKALKVRTNCPKSCKQQGAEPESQPRSA